MSRYPRLFAYIALTVTLLTGDSAHAAFMLDDFDDSFILTAATNARQTIEHDGVGDLSVHRRAEVTDIRRDSGVEVTASFEARDSLALVTMSELSEGILTNALRTNFTLVYNFTDGGESRGDLSEDGLNNAMLMDFAFVRGPTPLSAMRLHVLNRNGWHFALVQDLPFSDDPFTLSFPFEDFGDRGGSNIPADVEKVSNFIVEFLSAGLFSPPVPDEQWSIGLDRIRFGTVPEPNPALDFNDDQILSVSDIDALVGEIANGTNSLPFDLNEDGAVNDADLSAWLSAAASQHGFAEPYLLGDANLDGAVNANDLNKLGLNWRQNVALWSSGDFTADGIVSEADLNMLAINWLRAIPLAASNATPVPEPSSFFLTVVGLALVSVTRKLLEKPQTV